jgi:hypothetical protein
MTEEILSYEEVFGAALGAGPCRQGGRAGLARAGPTARGAGTGGHRRGARPDLGEGLRRARVFPQ